MKSTKQPTQTRRAQQVLYQSFTLHECMVSQKVSYCPALKYYSTLDPGLPLHTEIGETRNTQPELRLVNRACHHFVRDYTAAVSNLRDMVEWRWLDTTCSSLSLSRNLGSADWKTKSTAFPYLAYSMGPSEWLRGQTEEVVIGRTNLSGMYHRSSSLYEILNLTSHSW